MLNAEADGKPAGLMKERVALVIFSCGRKKASSGILHGLKLASRFDWKSSQ